ncbi:hypothetical protein GCM10010345_74510 [Streptomyces canarius]|uniref:Uncharacterized protein n=1 Tax=Streptomyces canarius TaxID=285453 RepID=A0ABQ3DBA2_9ACTN|nr:hypothetical protein GCM10010345_74510 [Streptomyces canarius]
MPESMETWPPAGFRSRAGVCAGVVSSFPHDLTLRRRLAEVNRLYGDAAAAATVFAEKQLVAVRAACAEELGHLVDCDDPATYRDSLEKRDEEAPSASWPVGGVLAGVGCLVGALAFLAIRVNGVVALFD